MTLQEQKKKRLIDMVMVYNTITNKDITLPKIKRELDTLIEHTRQETLEKVESILFTEHGVRWGEAAEVLEKMLEEVRDLQDQHKDL